MIASVRRATLPSPSEQLRVNLEEKRKQVDKLNAAHAQVKDKQTALQTSVNSSEELLQTLLTGLSSSKDGNTGGGYMGKIADAQARLATGQAEEQSSRNQLDRCGKDLKALEAEWKKVERDASDAKRNLETMRANVDNFRRRLAETGWSAEQEQSHENDLRNAKNEVRRLSEVCPVNSLSAPPKMLMPHLSSVIRSNGACGMWTLSMRCLILTSIVTRSRGSSRLSSVSIRSTTRLQRRSRSRRADGCTTSWSKATK